jgi:hypothetical protein
MNVVAIRSAGTSRVNDSERRPPDIVLEGPGAIEVDGELLPRWFRTSDGRYWEADRICSLGEARTIDAEGRVVAPGVLYRHISTKRLIGRWLILAASLAVLTVAAVFVLGVRV